MKKKSFLRPRCEIAVKNWRPILPCSYFWTFVHCALPALMVPASQTCRRQQCFSNTSNTDVNVPWGVDCSMGFKATRALCSNAWTTDTKLEVFLSIPNILADWADQLNKL